MGKYPNLITSLIALSGQENVIIVYRAFVDFTGTLEAAMMLSQLLYWTPRSRGWIAKSDEEFSDELCLSSYATRKARKQLEAMDILATTIRKFAGRPVVHYQLDLETLNRKWTLWIRKVDFAKTQSGLCENAKTLTETTTETTTEYSARAENTSSPSAEQPPTAMETPDQDSSEEPPPTADDDPDGAKEFLAAFGEQPNREPTTSDGDWTARQQRAQKDEPWLGWSDGKLHPHSGIGVDKLECVGWLIERETGRVPIDGQWQGWGKACAAIYQAGEGDFPAILEGIRRAWAREEQYRPRHPMGHVNEIANVKAGKKTAKIERYSEAWYKKRMQEDPQRELNEIAYERTQQQ